MSEADIEEPEEVTEEDVIIQTPNGERYPAAEVDLTGQVSTDE